jgi:hypothetical protein
MTVARAAAFVRTRPDRAISVNWLASALIVASAIELTILRIGTRTVIHIPGIEAVEGPYRLVAAVGRLAFFSAVVLVVMLLVSIMIERRNERDIGVVAAVACFLSVAAVVGLELLPVDAASLIVVAVVASFGLMTANRLRHPMVFVPLMFVLGYLLSALQSLRWSGALSNGLDAFGLASSIRLAELLVVGAALLSLPIWCRASGRPWSQRSRHAWVSVAAGLLVTAALYGNSSTTTVLMMWNFGLTGTLPAVVYGAAITSLLLTVSSIVRSDHNRLAAAVVLLALGGLGLTSTYQSALTVAGLALLLPARPHGSAGTRPMPITVNA